MPGAPDPISSPELYQACRDGLTVIAKLSGFPEAEVIKHMGSDSSEFRRLYGKEIAVSDLFISKLAILPTICAKSGTRISVAEMTHTVTVAISQISTARERASILR